MGHWERFTERGSREGRRLTSSSTGGKARKLTLDKKAPVTNRLVRKRKKKHAEKGLGGEGGGINVLVHRKGGSLPS